MNTDKPRKVIMSTDKGKKTDREVSLTRRALIKAGWAVPVILSIGLPIGNVFVHASTGRRSSSSNFGSRGNRQSGLRSWLNSLFGRSRR
jgi:hypothetical protein